MENREHVKSNAIVVGSDKQTLGIGAGQMNRIGSALIALEQAGEKAKGAVLASDAFFQWMIRLKLRRNQESQRLFSLVDLSKIKNQLRWQINMVFLWF